MAVNTDEFFARYQKAVNAKDAEEVAQFHMLPSVFVLDDIRRVATTREELLQIQTRFLNALSMQSIDSVEASVNQAIVMSDNVIFANVKWDFKGADNTVKLTSFCSYTMQIEDEDRLNIIVAVIDDQDKVLASLMTEENT